MSLCQRMLSSKRPVLQGLGGIPVQPPPRQVPSFADSTPGSGSLGNTWPARPQKPAQVGHPGVVLCV